MASLSTRSRRGTEPEFELNDRVDHITKKKPSSGETKNNNTPPPVDVFDIDKIYQFKWAIPAEHCGSGMVQEVSLFRDKEAISYFDDKYGYGCLPYFENYGFLPVVSSEIIMHFVGKMDEVKADIFDEDGAGSDNPNIDNEIEAVFNEYRNWVAKQAACHKESLDYELVSQKDNIFAIILKYDDEEGLCFLVNNEEDLRSFEMDSEVWHMTYCGRLDIYSIETLKDDEEDTDNTFECDDMSLHQEERFKDTDDEEEVELFLCSGCNERFPHIFIRQCDEGNGYGCAKYFCNDKCSKMLKSRYLKGTYPRAHCVDCWDDSWVGYDGKGFAGK
jgi:hypothetical protein